MLAKFKSASPAAKASMAMMISNIFLKGLSLISGPIFTRIMTTEQYGIVSTFLSWESLLAVIVTLNLSSGVFNNGMMEFKENRDVFQFSLLFVSGISAFAFFIISFLFDNIITRITGLDSKLIIILFLYFLFTPAYWYWGGRQRYEFKYKAISLVTVVSVIVALCVGIILVLVAPDKETSLYRILSFDGINILVGVFFSIYLGYKASFRIKVKYCIYALKFNLPLIPHYLSMYVLSSSDRIMISRMISNSATAIFSVASTVGSVITILWQSIEASLAPWIYEKLSAGKVDQVKKVTSEIMITFSVLSLGCTLFAPEIMAVLAPHSYISGTYVIPSIAAGVFFTAMYSLYMRVELYYKHTQFAAIASFIAALVNIGLNYIFINIVGAVAAGYTTMLCYALLAFLHYYNVKKKGHEECFNNRLFFFLSLVCIGVAIVITLLYSYTYVRYIAMIIGICVLFINKSKLMDIWKGIKGDENIK